MYSSYPTTARVVCCKQATLNKSYVQNQIKLQIFNNLLPNNARSSNVYIYRNRTISFLMTKQHETQRCLNRNQPFYL